MVCEEEENVMLKCDLGLLRLFYQRVHCWMADCLSVLHLTDQFIPLCYEVVGALLTIS